MHLHRSERLGVMVRGKGEHGEKVPVAVRHAACGNTVSVQADAPTGVGVPGGTGSRSVSGRRIVQTQAKRRADAGEPLGVEPIGVELHPHPEISTRVQGPRSTLPGLPAGPPRPKHPLAIGG